MKQHLKSHTLLVIFLLLACSAQAQRLTGVIKYKKSGSLYPDAGTKIYLCPRTAGIHFDADKVKRRDELLTEYDLTLEGSAKQRAKHKKNLSNLFKVNDTFDMRQYLADAEHEEDKIISAQNVLTRTADSAGHYSFDSVAAGNYLLLIKSGNTNKSDHAAFDIATSWIVINRLFGEYSESGKRKFYLDENLR